MRTEEDDLMMVSVIGAGPAGLMAAEVFLEDGIQVDLFDAMPSAGRKFLRAGKGGLNLTHSEPMDLFLSRYGARRSNLEPIINAFSPHDLRKWAHQLGFNTFVGSSGRVFPENFNSTPILRSWITRLKSQGLKLYPHHKWLGWEDQFLLHFDTPKGEKVVKSSAVVVALGGGSWSGLGSDGAWVSVFREKGIPVQTLKPTNCGFDINWSGTFRERYNGNPVKPVVINFSSNDGVKTRKKGEFIITRTGIEGSAIYAISSILRNEIEAAGRAVIELDLAPDWSVERLIHQLSQPRGARTITNHLKKTVGIEGVKIGLLYETLERKDFDDSSVLAKAIKATRLELEAPRPLDEAISSAGGVVFEALDQNLMLREYPGMFCAGEMLDWEAPTGGYLLTACFATGRWAGRGAASWLARKG